MHLQCFSNGLKKIQFAQGLIFKPCPKSWRHLRIPNSQSKNPLEVLGFILLHFPTIVGMCLNHEHSFNSLPCHALTSIMSPKLRLQQWLTSPMPHVMLGMVLVCNEYNVLKLGGV
jgi:hypothetical protein